MATRTLVAFTLAGALAALAAPHPASAQGCVCQKQGGPVFGGVSPYLDRGDFQLLLHYRGSKAVEHFRGREPLAELDANGPRNVQHLWTAELTYAASRRLSLALSGPLQFNQFDVRRAAPGSSQRQWVPIRASGLGDLSLRARYWLLDPDAKQSGGRNVGLALGLKLPTGQADRSDDYFGRQVPVDVSIQPGDKSWAGTAGLYAFQGAGPVTLFAMGSYLFNPRNTTGVPTFFGSLNNPANSTLNSAADQFSVQMGVSASLAEGWPVPSIAYRVEGVPIRDRIGASDGFRRPGTIGFVEPGLNHAVGRHLLGVGLAIRAYVNIKDSPTSTRVEDATVPKYMFTAAYSIRF